MTEQTAAQPAPSKQSQAQRQDAEIKAMSAVRKAVAGLDEAAQLRVLSWALQRAQDDFGREPCDLHETRACQ